MSLKTESKILAVRILEAHMHQKKLAPAYIFSSSASVEENEENRIRKKEEFIALFASALENGKTKFFNSEDTLISKKISDRTHPDVRWVGEDITQKSIKIGEVRDVLHWVSMKPYEGEWKVCIIVKAERLTEGAANAFLKTLEEPPANTVFCLIVENKNYLLETVQSRCFEIKLNSSYDKSTSEYAPKNVSPVLLKEILDVYSGLKRNELKEKLENLMMIFRKYIQEDTSKDSDDFNKITARLKAIDVIYDTTLALDANANQKLTMTRLVMKLRQLFPLQKAVP